MTSECGAHFSLIAVVGVDEIRADEQENEVRFGEVLIDRVIDDSAGDDPPVIPRVDEGTSSKGGEVLCEFITEPLITVSVGHEHADP
jgi:hypothetical protein